MGTILDYDTGEVVEVSAGPWWGSHAKPRRSLWVLLATGHRLNYPWSAYHGATFRGAGRLTLYFTHANVGLTGRHLEPLAALVGSHGAFYIREQHTSIFDTPDDAPYIERIDIGPPNAQELGRKP